ncbi:hypothetical protein DFH08DRAFT_808400 [Mycena albidolilacea]|uniref:Heterokaryon incompatibility domain-containing protein n=1 Tax=Mycena albidolilacea TaxID=1033008 RepID=A0AAD7ESK6_9AGAR|nr:hypothetical protein DFH08DRAFT_808400 [Mycena albidolilacea]
MWNPFSGTRQGFRAFRSSFRLRRLFRERAGVESSGYFHKDPKKASGLVSRFHILGNVLRLIFNLLISPLILVVQLFLPGGTGFITDYIKGRADILRGNIVDSSPESHADSDSDSESDAESESDADSDSTDEGVDVNAPDAVLTRDDGEDGQRYEGTGFGPTWLLQVTLRDGAEFGYDSNFPTQVNATDFANQHGQWPPSYTALSYSLQSAEVACTAAGLQLPQKDPGDRKYSSASRRQMSKQILKLFCSARLKEGKNPDEVEYIWLDEFCISDATLNDHTHKKEIKNQHHLELGRMADIYRSADEVTVFCHTENCRHTDLLNCVWTKRLWTLAEILNAQTVATMTMTREPDTGFTARLSTQSGHVFREVLQAKAAQANKWHLYAIFQKTDHAGAAPLQVVIHALVVEAIRRDEASGHSDHDVLGKALNGLLPRRARLKDLGHGGWTDLAWLLELNQAFYNAAALAAVCCIINDNDESGSWLGKPIHPAPGNERLEPIVTAFPIGRKNHNAEATPEHGQDAISPGPLAPGCASPAPGLPPGSAPVASGPEPQHQHQHEAALALLPPGAAPPNRGSKHGTPLTAAPIAPHRNVSSRDGMSLRPVRTRRDAIPLAAFPPSAEKQRPTPPLMIVRAQTLTLREILKRDPNGLYNNKEVMNGFKNLILLLLFVLFIIIAVVLVIVLPSGTPTNDSNTIRTLLPILVPLYVCTMLYQLLELLVGTMYLERDGWVFLEKSDWFRPGQRPELGNQDRRRQLVPEWEEPPLPERPQHFARFTVSTTRGKLVDLSTGVCVDAVVTEPPDFIIPLAIHGSGVTCMLLKRPKNVSQNPAYQAKKVGMANFPTYILAQMDKATDRTIIVSSERKVSEKPGAADIPPTGGNIV